MLSGSVMVNNDVSGDLKHPRRQFMHRGRMQIQLRLQNNILNKVVCRMRVLYAAADKASQAVSYLDPISKSYTTGSAFEDTHPRLHGQASRRSDIQHVPAPATWRHCVNITIEAGITGDDVQSCKADRSPQRNGTSSGYGYACHEHGPHETQRRP